MVEVISFIYNAQSAMTMDVYRLGASRLAASVSECGPHLVIALQGRADSTSRETLAEVAERVLLHSGSTVAFDLEELEEAWGSGLDALVRLVRECHRLDRRVALVRCREEFFNRLRDAGLRGPVEHLPSLAAATDGAIEDGLQTIRLHFESHARSLTMVRKVLRTVTRRAGFSEAVQDEILMAVVEACTNAILHGSSDDDDGRIGLCIYLGPSSLVIDVADEGRGFTPGGLRPPDLEHPAEHGYGLFIIRRVMDRLEVFNSDAGTVVRMTKSLLPAADEASALCSAVPMGGVR